MLNTSAFRSTDGGKTLVSIGTGTHGDHHDFWIDPDDSNHVMDGNDGGGAISYNVASPHAPLVGSGLRDRAVLSRDHDEARPVLRLRRAAGQLDAVRGEQDQPPRRRVAAACRRRSMPAAASRATSRPIRGIRTSSTPARTTDRSSRASTAAPASCAKSVRIRASSRARTRHRSSSAGSGRIRSSSRRSIPTFSTPRRSTSGRRPTADRRGTRSAAT